jgi:hypothetical protein
MFHDLEIQTSKELLIGSNQEFYNRSGEKFRVLVQGNTETGNELDLGRCSSFASAQGCFCASRWIGQPFPAWVKDTALLT